MAFRVGQKVACIKGGVFCHPENPNSVILNKGDVFTIRGIDEPSADCAVLGLWFVEIKLEPLEGCQEPSFAARRFRPIVEPKTDISIFTAMLETKKAKEPV